ncbi:helix-turn-helix protein [Melghirimyces profundicolus]|uniref:Helix-turn-helix protein n=1 Tax=Melghirimyces profundicolus TaxID=1242148 RepID=A0A2T6BD17_9BACL|nr:helix-turn-helix transcriptional regulator [Melghirimyces profundicolus]PTX53970.1 helix-turn-helix protein [Melghirimyces profundicolus]
MIKTDAEYQKSLRQLEVQRKDIEQKEKFFREKGLTEEQTKIALEPLWAFYYNIEDEVRYYENVKKGKFSCSTNLKQVGHLLICYRIYKGITQKELADRLGVSPAQVSRDERNEYKGASSDKLQRVAEKLGIPLSVQPQNEKDMLTN